MVRDTLDPVIHRRRTHADHGRQGAPAAVRRGDPPDVQRGGAALDGSVDLRLCRRQAWDGRRHWRSCPPPEESRETAPPREAMPDGAVALPSTARRRRLVAESGRGRHDARRQSDTLRHRQFEPYKDGHQYRPESHIAVQHRRLKGHCRALPPKTYSAHRSSVSRAA